MSASKMAIYSFLLTYANFIITYWNLIHIKFQDQDISFVSIEDKIETIGLHKANWKLLTTFNHQVFLQMMLENALFLFAVYSFVFIFKRFQPHYQL